MWPSAARRSSVTLGQAVADQVVHGGLDVRMLLLERARQVLEIVALGRRVGDEFEEQPSLQLIAVARGRVAVEGPGDRVILHRSTPPVPAPGDVPASPAALLHSL
jgi:hypothetical protein